MKKIALILISILAFSSAAWAQTPDAQQQELEKERQKLKEELDEKQSLLNANKQNTKKGLSELAKINAKLELQERVVNNINRQINLIDNRITKSQHDVRRL